MSEVIAFPGRSRASISYVRSETALPTYTGEWHECPWSDSVTEYDKRHIALFYRLMHDEFEGATEFDIARDVFGISFWFQSQKAQKIVRSHTGRAHWLAENVFPLLGW